MPNIHRFGSFELDLETGDLHGNGRSVRLPEQQFQILQMLLFRQGGVVSRVEIRQRLWPDDTVVEFDRSINAAILKLRSALRETADQPECIETVTRRGYRFILPPAAKGGSPANGNAPTAIPAPSPEVPPKSLVGQKVAHYQVQGVLGSGGMGVVYSGEDLKLNRPVALKFLSEDLARDCSTLRRFEREARTASQLNHPNICTIYQIEEHQGQPFIVMELLAGQNLRDLIAGSTRENGGESRRLPIETLLDIAIQIADGLDAAHQKGIIHRDIKPANVFVTPEGQVKILDFGLAKLLDTGPVCEIPGSPSSGPISLSGRGQVVGTPDYMSPEQVRGEALDPRSDLFSFGILLCELLGVPHPFRRATSSETSQAILSDPPNLSGDLPQGLIVLIRRLLVKTLDTRYRSMSEVRADLRRLATGVAPEQESEVGARIPLIGRESEFAELKRALHDAIAGRGGLVMIGGEPGIGKTHLTHAILEEARHRGAVGVVGHCYEMEGAPPYVPFIEILEYTVRMAPKASLRLSLGDDAPEVARLMPELRNRYPDIPPAIQLPPEQQRRFLFNAFRSYVERAARVTPIVAVLEDLHWADEPTLLLMQHVAQTLSTMPLLIVCTYRDVELEVTRPFARTLETLLRKKQATRISLRRLPLSGVKGMLAAMSGQTPPPLLARAIFEETEGNPFFVEEVVRHLSEEGKLFDQDGKWLSGLRVDQLQVPESVRLVLGRRLDRLGADARRVLTTAAVIGRSFSLRLLEELESKQTDAVLDAIEEAEQAHLVKPEPEGRDTRYRFVHELVRQTLAESLSLPRRQRLHARVADGIERVYAANLAAQASPLAHHLYQAGASADTEKTTTYLALAARQARAGSAHEEALGHLEHALSLCEEEKGPRVAELLEQHAGTLQSLGRQDEAVSSYHKAIEHYQEAGIVAKVAEVSIALGYLQGWRLQTEAAIRTTEKAVHQLQGQYPKLQRSLLSMRAAITSNSGDVVTADRIFNEVRELEKTIDDSTKGRANLLEVIHFYQSLQLEKTFAASREFADLCRNAGDSWGACSVEYYQLFAAAYSGRTATLNSERSEALAQAEKIGHHGAVWALMYLAPILSAARGDLATAGREIEEAWNYGESNAVGWNFINSIHRGTFALWNGDLAEAERWYNHGSKVEVRSYLSGLSEASRFAALAECGDPRAADAWANRHWKLPASGQRNPLGAWAALERSVIGLARLNLKEEIATLQPLTEQLTETGAWTYSLQSPFLTVAGIAAAAAGNWTAAERHHQSAIHQTDTAPYRHLQPVAREWYARTLLDRNAKADRAQARILLCEALSLHETMPMPFRARHAAETLAGL